MFSPSELQSEFIAVFLRMPMARISQFFVEMRRRHVFRVTGIYIVTAWVILQVADLAFESFGLPAEALRFVWYALIAVSPLAVFWIPVVAIFCIRLLAVRYQVALPTFGPTDDDTHP